LTTNTKPKRLILFLSPNNPDFLLQSIINAKTKLNEYNIDLSQILVFYDSNSIKKINPEILKNEIINLIPNVTKTSILFNEVPIINDLMRIPFPYDFENFDCIIVPPLQLHLSLLLNSVNSKISYLPKTVFLFHTHPDGKLLTFSRLIFEDGNCSYKPFLEERKNMDNLYSILKNKGCEFDRLMHVVDPIIANRLIHQENLRTISDDDLMTHFIQHTLPEEYQIEERRRDALGRAFEKLANYCFYSNASIFSDNIATNVFFKSNSKYIHREEDILAINQNNKLLVVSCKAAFSSQISSATTRNLNKEIKRLNSLELPINFPKERIHKILVTSTPAVSKLGKEKNGVMITNLLGLDDLLSKI
tara:strand:+ start:87 stop:1169 length:1083 start_codon:yes stop_codon:yes gene_type:complete